MSMQRERRKRMNARPNTDVAFSGGPGCMSDEAPVMGVEQRTGAIQIVSS